MALSSLSGCFGLSRPWRIFFRIPLGLATLATLTAPLGAQYEESILSRFDYDKSLSLSLIHDTNVGQRSNSRGDTIVSGNVTLGASREFRFATLGAELSAVAAKYFEFDQLDYQDININWIIDTTERGGNRRFSYTLDADVRQETSSDSVALGQTSSRIIGAGATVSYLLSRTTSIGASVRYNDRDPLGNSKRIDDDGNVQEVDNLYGNTTMTYAAWASWIQNAQLQYRLTASRNVTDSDRLSARDGYNDSLMLSAIGQITSRLSGTLSAGVQRREIDDELANSTTPTFSASLDYTVDERSAANLSGSRSFGNSLSGASTDVTSVSLRYRRQITRFWSGSISTQYQQSEYVFDPIVIELPDEVIVFKREHSSTVWTYRVSASRELSEKSQIDLAASWTDYDSDFTSGRADRFRTTLTYRLEF